MKIKLFEKLNPRQVLIICCATLVIIVLLVWLAYNHQLKKGVIDYKNVNMSELLKKSTIDNNRDDYWLLNSIINDLLNAYDSSIVGTTSNSGGMISKYTVEETYDFLDAGYKATISKGEYVKLYKKIFSDVNEIRYITQVIDQVYKVNNLTDCYIVKLTSSGLYNMYIGIDVNRNKSTFNIFYLYMEEKTYE